MVKPLVSTLLDGSLFELQEAWRSVDHHRHINQFISINQVKIALAQAGCSQHHLDLAAITVWYETAFMLMRDLKGIGANHVSGRSTGLISRRTLAKWNWPTNHFVTNRVLCLPHIRFV